MLTHHDRLASHVILHRILAEVVEQKLVERGHCYKEAQQLIMDPSARIQHIQMRWFCGEAGVQGVNAIK